MAPTLVIHDTTVEPGQRRRLEIPVAMLPTETWLSLPVEVVNGRRDGPRLWLSAAVHGDELNGVEVIRRVLEEIEPASLRGAVIAVPVVNVFGFIIQSRYLPDRRDLNRCFPGSRRGSLAARLAHLFMNEIVTQCTHGIDLHTGSNHRTNLPQIRVNLDDQAARRCARAFAAPVTVHAKTRDGSLRESAAARGIPVLLYEAGEPLRFDSTSIDQGVRGILGVMAELGMRRGRPGRTRRLSREYRKTVWIRARRSGILRLSVELGSTVLRRQEIGRIGDALGTKRVRVTAPTDGMVIGCTNNPLVNRGDAIVHVATELADPPES